MFDTTMTLPDGRVLGFAELGSSSGPLVIYFHGAPSSRLDLTAYDEAFAAAGVRVVCPDRPGYGTSSPQPGRVRVLHSEADNLVPLAHAPHTAELIPGSVLEILPGHGHLSMFNEFPRVIAELATSVR
jgi:pimeloyl-ACP methyl ester carboxylesterase